MNNVLTLVLCCAFFSAFSQRARSSPEVQKMRRQLAALDRHVDSLRARADAAYIEFARYDTIISNGTAVPKQAPTQNADSLKSWTARKTAAEHQWDTLLVQLDSCLGVRNDLIKKIALWKD